jgi:GT2 family glycosyltransferase
MGQRPASSVRPSIRWVVLTMGTRPEALRRSVGSLAPHETIVVLNGTTSAAVDVPATTLSLAENEGVPGGRDAGVTATTTDVIGFLDDDAEFRGAPDSVADAFADDPDLGAVALRLVDETGETARRHVPRLGGRHPDRRGDVALFLGGASAIRRAAYEEVGGYFTDLFYGHEEVELCWRLVDSGWRIRYLADVEVFHPRTTIERHPEGWELTGRNRVLIARRTLPWPIAIVHVIAWLVLGTLRAPTGESRRRYLAGWRRGWRVAVDRAPISWAGVWRLTRLGRPPIV